MWKDKRQGRGVECNEGNNLVLQAFQLDALICRMLVHDGQLVAAHQRHKLPVHLLRHCTLLAALDALAHLIACKHMITRGLIKNTVQRFKMQYLQWQFRRPVELLQGRFAVSAVPGTSSTAGFAQSASGRGKARMQVPGAVVEQCPGPPW